MKKAVLELATKILNKSLVVDRQSSRGTLHPMVMTTNHRALTRSTDRRHRNDKNSQDQVQIWALKGTMGSL